MEVLLVIAFFAFIVLDIAAVGVILTQYQSLYIKIIKVILVLLIPFIGSLYILNNGFKFKGNKKNDIYNDGYSDISDTY